MRQLLVIFLLVFLPFQFTWAAAAAYCAHEGGEVAHFGHHAHQHPADDGDQSNNKKPGVGMDADCIVCHAGCVAAPAGLLMILPRIDASPGNPWLPYFLISPPGERPERPNWPVSA
ncbi:MAG: hypothetical protein LBQ81_08765 [Zoogloeaceae bacterium]|nr:hypothetical protein [Zoogloeaceae bacterium]